MKRSGKKNVAVTVNSYKIVHWILFALVLVNLYVVFCFERDRSPRTVVETVTTVSNHVFVVTNFFPLVNGSDDAAVSSLPTNSLGGVVVNDPAYEIPLSYHFYSQGSRKFVQIAGFNFTIGDDTSYGRIVSIFPERIMLHNGYAIKNMDFEERFGFGSAAQNFRRQFAQTVASNDSVVVAVRPRTLGNYHSGYSVGSRLNSKTNNNERTLKK